MIPLEEARQFVLSQMRPLPPVTVALDEALGCVAAEPVVAGGPIPEFANSQMDGYALRSADAAAGGRLRVVGTVVAGQSAEVSVGAGEAVRIMTGAPIPPGADAVCMVERTVTEDGGAVVVVDGPVRPGEYVRLPGSDVKAGEVVIEAGTVLGPAHLGVLASLGAASVAVHRRPRVGVLSTGDELVTAGQPLGPGAVRDANRPTLLALAAASGFAAADLGIVADDEDRIAAAISEATGHCDAIVTSGGVSMGDRDYVKTVLDKMTDGSMRWMQVAIKPAKPFAFGVLAATGTPVFGLPGNRVSAMVSFELFVRPALRKLAGHHLLDRPRTAAVADEDLGRVVDGKLHLARVVATFGDDGRVHVRSSGGQASHMLLGMARANALALLPDGDGARRGDRVQVMLLDAEGLAAVGAEGPP
ncbi:MAG: gephyrin-like molybdotransferase Glp [Acidimicrobiales bacterium]